MPTSLNPLDTLWQARTIIWTLLAVEVLAAVLAIAPGNHGDRLIYFGVTSMVIQWIALMTLGLLYPMRRRIALLSPPFIAYIALIVLIVSTWLVLLLGWIALGDLLIVPNGGWRRLSLQVTVISLLTGLLGLAAFQNHWRTRQLAVRAKQAELDALRARVNPHFLFNTLNTAAALLHEQPDQAERVLLDLSDLFRAALSGEEETRLEQELLLTRRYLEIEALRLGARLDVGWAVPDPLPVLNVPTLSLQTLAENAIHHGIEARPGAGDVRIEVVPDARTVTLRVSNPLPGNLPATPRHQVGLAASRARIEAMTAGQGELRTRQCDGRFIAEIILPLEGANPPA